MPLHSEHNLHVNQANRRRRILRAALELAAQGGYHGVQMREVAIHADVSLGTVYHYFDSKDHLLAATLVDWTRELAASVARKPAVGNTTLEKILDILRRITYATQSNQKISAAIVGGLLSEGEHVATCYREIHDTFSAILETAFDLDFDPIRRDKIIRVLQHVWLSELVCWKNGWFPIDQCVREFEDTAKMLLNEDSHTPTSAEHLVEFQVG